MFEIEDYILADDVSSKELLKEVMQSDYETIYIYDDHLGAEPYITSYKMTYEELYCCQCGDSDTLIWCGTKEEFIETYNELKCFEENFSGIKMKNIKKMMSDIESINSENIYIYSNPDREFYVKDINDCNKNDDYLAWGGAKEDFIDFYSDLLYSVGEY